VRAALARSLSDAGIGIAIRALEAKAAMHGKTVVKIDRWFPSSKMCSACGCLQSDMPLAVRQWTCDCGATHDRDENAAINICTVGQTGLYGRGDDVRAA
jgi:putative transposase